MFPIHLHQVHFSYKNLAIGLGNIRSNVLWHFVCDLTGTQNRQIIATQDSLQPLRQPPAKELPADWWQPVGPTFFALATSALLFGHKTQRGMGENPYIQRWD